MHDEIRKALDAATPGPWKTDLWPRTDDIGIQQAHAITQYVAQMSGRNENKHADAHLIANAPTWLRTLLEENERLTKEKADVYREWAKTEEQLREELEQVKKERDIARHNWNDGMALEAELCEEIESLRSQLAEKDKALEWYADGENWVDKAGWFSPVKTDNGRLARSILLRYKVTE